MVTQLTNHSRTLSQMKKRGQLHSMDAALPLSKDSCYTVHLEMNKLQSWCGYDSEERDKQKLKCIPLTCCQSVP